MDYHLQLLQPPTVEPITLAEAKEQCRIRHEHSNQRLGRLIQSAREQAEGATRRAMLRQTWEQTQVLRGSRIPLQRWPVLVVDQVTADGETLADSLYRVRPGDGACVQLIGDYCGAEVAVTFQAGYGDQASAVPASLREWMLTKVADAYANPGAAVIGTINSKLDFIDALLGPFVVPR